MLGPIKNFLKLILSTLTHKPVSVNISTLAPSSLLEGRTALITGGTGGIGFTIASAFVNAGAKVIITGRNPETVTDCAKRLGNNALAIKLDVTDFTKLESGVASILKANPQIDCLVNCAGIGGGAFCTTTPEEFDRVINTNLKSAFFISRIVANHMISHKIKGNILNISSASSLRPADSAYILSKWGLRSLTLGLAKMLIKHDIVVNAIAPGPTATPMLNKSDISDIGLGTHPTGRMAIPQEVADFAVVLVSNIGRYIIGDTIYMTGGSGVITFDDVPYDFQSPLNQI